MSVMFSAWSIHRPSPAILLFFLATVAGFLGFHALQIAKMPDFDFPGIIVDVQLPGATPSQLETEVTRKIEDATANIPGARHVTSTIPARKSVVEGKSVSGRVDLGGRRIIKKKKQ